MVCYINKEIINNEVVQNAGFFEKQLFNLQMDFSGLNDADKARMQTLIEQKQMKDFMRLYTGLVDRCFKDCIHDFTSKSLSGKEVYFKKNHDSNLFREIVLNDVRINS